MTHKYQAALLLNQGEKIFPTVVCLHGAGANATMFLLLSRFLPSRITLIAMQSPGYDGIHPPYASVELAVRAAILQKFVDLVEMDKGTSLNIQKDYLTMFDEKQQLEVVLNAMIQGKIFSPNTSLAYFENIVKVFEVSYNTSYQPLGTYVEEILLLDAQEKSPCQHSDTLGKDWVDYVPNIQSLIVPGSNHMSLLQSSHIELIAKNFSSYGTFKFSVLISVSILWNGFIKGMLCA